METTSEIDKKELHYLYCDFKDYFCGKVDIVMYTGALTKFTLYINQVTQESLENFVEEYFKMRSSIVSSRNELMDYIATDEYKDEVLINKLKIRKQLNKAQNLCYALSEFEEEFYKKTNISLLRVENERWAREEVVQSADDLGITEADLLGS